MVKSEWDPQKGALNKPGRRISQTKFNLLWKLVWDFVSRVWGFGSRLWDRQRISKSLSQLSWINEREHIIRTFALKLAPLDGVHVGEYQINSPLCEAVKGWSRRHYIPKQRMVVLNVWLLVRRIRIAKEYGSPLFPGGVVFKGKTLLNSPPLSVSKTGNISPKQKPFAFSRSFRSVIIAPVSAAVLSSKEISNIKSTLTNWKVMMIFPPMEPIKVSISVQPAMGVPP